MARSSDLQHTPLRVCILAEANPLIWIHHYIQAFREHCDVLTVGPSLSPADLESMGKAHQAHLLYRNDIDAEIGDIDQLEEALPAGWRPHLIVSIQSGRGVVHGLARLRCPTAYISVDTWHSPMEYVYALQHEFVFVAQREFVRRFQATGSRHVRWLPLACNPSAHHPVQVEKDLDIAFVGSCGRRVHEQRRERLKRLAAYFKVDIDDGLCEQDMCRMLARARLVFNSSIAGDLNMRVFEALGMGAALLTDRAASANGLLDLFTDGEHLIAYDDDTLVDVARHYLEDNEARERIACAGRRLVLESETYSHRVRTILGTVCGMMPCIRDEGIPFLRQGGALRDHLPSAPGVLVDLGLGLGATKYALRRLGTKKCFGASRDAEEAQRRAGSYDEMLAPGAAALPENFGDTVVLTNLTVVESKDTHALDIAYGLLRSGGTLVACLVPEESSGQGIAPTVDGYAQWVEAHGFAFLTADTLSDQGDGKQAVVVTARKRTMTMRQAAAEVYEQHPMPNTTLEQVLATIPENL